MNSVKEDTFHRETGPNAEEALGLIRLLYGGQPFDGEMFYGSSIVTRSEVELFGVSQPRFAIRLESNKFGFMNCRRIVTFTESIRNVGPGVFGLPYSHEVLVARGQTDDLPEEHEFRQVSVEGLAAQFLDKSIIADSLLRPPPALREAGFKILPLKSSSILKAYHMEDIDPGDDSLFIPYLKAFEISGGQCAQAACFMCTVMLLPHSRLVCGIAEITAYTHDSDAAYLTLSGLSSRRMNGFFQHADLRLSEQSPSPKVIGNSPTDRQVQNLLFSCECYSQSGMPVVFPVDARGLYAKDGVYEQNDWQEAAPSTGHPAHCVVLVGYHHEEQLLLFNDPSAMPFMLMHVTEAITLGCIKSDYGTTYADNGVFMPVTPTEVRMLLAYQRNIEDNGGPKQRPGLLTLSRWMSCICRSLEHKNGPLSRKPHQDKLLPRFLLCQHNDADLNRIPQLSTQYRDEWSEPLQKLMARISSARRWQAAHWTWVEMLNDSIWVWNAEMETPRRMPKGESNADCIRKGLQWVLGIVYRNDKGEFQYHPFAWPA